MSPAEFDGQFNRLTAHFHLPTESNRDQVALDWLKAVEHYHVDALDHGVTDLIRQSQDRFWPSLGKLLVIVRGRIAGMEKAGKCATCHGSGWLDSAPFKANGMIYENVVARCHDCGIPSPQYTAPSHRQELTAHEYAEWGRKEHDRNYMPHGLEAKTRPEGEVTEIKAAMERLRIKLFGTFDENNGGVA